MRVKVYDLEGAKWVLTIKKYMNNNYSTVNKEQIAKVSKQYAFYSNGHKTILLFHDVQLNYF